MSNAKESAVANGVDSDTTLAFQLALSANTCSCLNWKDTYAKDMAVCDAQGCDQLKQKDDTKCLDAGGGGWCYVNKECKDLQGGQIAMGGKVAWKKCKADSDAEDSGEKESAVA